MDLESWPSFDEDKVEEFENTFDPLYHHYLSECSGTDGWDGGLCCWSDDLDMFVNAPISPAELGIGNEKVVQVVDKSEKDREREFLAKYYHLTMSEAAVELNASLTNFKQRCRRADIARWPCRKLTSLQTLTNNLKETGKETCFLEQEMKEILETNPNMELGKETKKLRQRIYKKRYLAKNKSS